MVAPLEIKALNKATRKPGLCSTKRVLYQCRLAIGQWRKSYHELTSPQKPVVSRLDPPPASGTCRPPPLVLAYMTSFSPVVGLQRMHVYNECMNFVNNNCLFCGALAAGYQINAIATLRSVPFIR